MSLPEVLLWERLRGRASGLKFRRQHPLGRYVLDFYCASASLVVEIDGEAHDRGDRPARDLDRDAFCRSRGLAMMRIAAAEVLRDPDEIADAIARAALPLHHRALRDGPPPHAVHGKDLEGRI